MLCPVAHQAGDVLSPSTKENDPYCHSTTAKSFVRVVNSLDSRAGPAPPDTYELEVLGKKQETIPDFVRRTSRRLVEKYSFSLKRQLPESALFATLYLGDSTVERQNLLAALNGTNATNVTVARARFDMKLNASQHAAEVVFKLSRELRGSPCPFARDAEDGGKSCVGLHFVHFEPTWSYYMKEFGYRNPYPAPLFGLRESLSMEKGKNYVFDECFRELADDGIRAEDLSLKSGKSVSETGSSSSLALSGPTGAAPNKTTAEEEEQNSRLQRRISKKLKRFRRCFSSPKLRKFLKRAINQRAVEAFRSAREGSQPKSKFVSTPVKDTVWRTFERDVRDSEDDVVLELYDAGRDNAFAAESVLHMIAVVLREVRGLKFLRYGGGHSTRAVRLCPTREKLCLENNRRFYKSSADRDVNTTLLPKRYEVGENHVPAELRFSAGASSTRFFLVPGARRGAENSVLARAPVMFKESSPQGGGRGRAAAGVVGKIGL